MSSLIDRSLFGIYEIFSNIIPGFIVLVTAWEFIIAVSKTQVPSIDTSVFVVFFVFLSFAVGVAIQALSALFESLVNRKRGYSSSRLLHSNDRTFPQYFKDGVRRLAHERFGVPQDADSQHIFDLCYTYIIQNGISERVSQFLNMYTFARNMMVTMCIECFILLFWSMLTGAVGILFLALLSVALAFLFYLRFTRYARSFAEEVFRSFYVDMSIKKKAR